MNEAQRSAAAIIRGAYDAAHTDALVSLGVSDNVFILQVVAITFADHYLRLDPAFQRQAFLALAIDQPGITAVWDPQ